MKNETLKLIPDKISSAAGRLPLGTSVEVSMQMECMEGSVVAVQALEEKTTYDQVELSSGRMAKIIKNDILIGVLGARKALRGFVGRVPSSLAVGDTIHVLNLGGVMGECVSHNPDVGLPLRARVLGQVMLDGQPANIRSHALPWAERLENCAPLVLVSGTCMSAGKTLAACHIIRGLHHAGLKVGAGKVTGVSLKRDVLAMEDFGADKGLDFADFGLPSTTELADPSPVAKGLIKQLDMAGAEVIVIELGDGLLGGYGVRALLQDADIRRLTQVHVLCANDPVAAWGGKLLFDQLGLSMDCVCGPATDNAVGADFISTELGVPGINARSDGESLARLVLQKLKGKIGK